MRTINSGPQRKSIPEWGKLCVKSDRSKCEGRVSETEAKQLVGAARKVSGKFKDQKVKVLEKKASGESKTADELKDGDKLKAGQIVGVLAARDVVLEILPKIDLGNDQDTARRALVDMINVANDLDIAHTGTATLSKGEHLLDYWVRLFTEKLLSAVRYGLQHRYVATDDDLMFIRGKLDVHDKILRYACRPDRWPCSFDEFLVDTPMNRVLKAAVVKLGRATHSHSQGNARRLRELMARFDEVGDSSYPLREVVTRDRTSAAFQDLYDQARFFLKGDWQTTTSGKTQGFALMFPMNDLFEKFVGNSLERKLGKERVRQQDTSNAIVDTANREKRFELRPDIVVDKKIIIDTKWKELTTCSSSKHYKVKPCDINQILRYGGAYQAKHLILLYPWHSGLRECGRAKCHAYQRWETADAKTLIDIATIDLGRSLREVQESLSQYVKCVIKRTHAGAASQAKVD